MSLKLSFKRIVVFFSALALIGTGMLVNHRFISTAPAISPPTHPDILIDDKDCGDVPALWKEYFEEQDKFNKLSLQLDSKIKLIKSQKGIGDDYLPAPRDATKVPEGKGGLKFIWQDKNAPTAANTQPVK